MENGSFATVVNCMDGRTQIPANEWIRKKLSVDNVDTITEAGPDGILAEGDPVLVESIRKRVLISVDKHGSKNVVIVSHTDCAGNPVSKEEHMDHLRKAMVRIRDWDLGVAVIGIWIGGDWRVEEIETIH
jgi:carbonic anhydrase